MLELLVTTLALVKIRDSSIGIQNINRTITDVSHRSHVVVRLLARLIGMLVIKFDFEVTGLGILCCCV